MRLPLLALIVLLMAPLASAHGGVEPREIDERVITDGTGNGDYGASGSLDEGGLDLLSLDLRVSTLPGTDEPAILARVILQGGAAGEHRIDLHLGDAIYSWATSDLATYTSDSFTATTGPTEVGDGHPRAIEGYIPVAELGLAEGADLNDIRVTSHLGNNQADAMPGSWYYDGQEVPAEPGADDTPGTYTYTGLPTWFSVVTDVELISGDMEIQFNLTNDLTTLDQQVTLEAKVPSGMQGELSRTSVLLGPGETREVTLNLTGLGVGEVQLMATSDLAGQRTVTIAMEGDAEVGDGAYVESPLLNNSEVYQYRFTVPGRFEYHCHPHPFMLGGITIVADEPGEPESHVIRIRDGDEQETYGFFPAELTVQVNDTVIWVNEGTFQHNIMGGNLASGSHDHHDHDHGDEPVDEESPAPALALVLLGVLVAARRRSG